MSDTSERTNGSGDGQVDERSRHDRGRESQPDDRADVDESAEKVERLERHNRPADDSVGTTARTDEGDSPR